jgi:calcineurin-like phosphoesterase family protein
MIWHSSDYHLDHNNVIRYSKRPYVDAAAMNKHIYEVTNEYVKPDDLFIYNGDLGLPGELDDEFAYVAKVQEYLNNINCKHIIWVGGNHDRIFVKRDGVLVRNQPVWKLFRWQKQCLNCLHVDKNEAFEKKCPRCHEVSETEYIEGIHPMGFELQLSGKLCDQHKIPIVYKGSLLTCTHYSMRVWNKSQHNRQAIEGGKPPRSINLYGHSHGELPGIFCAFDCGWDVWYRPINIVEILETLMPAHNQTEAARTYFPHHGK